jgi:hypothetical protein
MDSRVNLTNAKHIVQSALTKLEGWVAEMVQYRLYRCPECAKAGHCVKLLPGETPPPGKDRVGCGCGVPAIMKVPQRVDSRGRWPQIADKEAWETFKIVSPDYQRYLAHIHNQEQEDDRSE